MHLLDSAHRLRLRYARRVRGDCRSRRRLIERVDDNSIVDFGRGANRGGRICRTRFGGSWQQIRKLTGILRELRPLNLVGCPLRLRRPQGNAVRRGGIGNRRRRRCALRRWHLAERCIGWWHGRGHRVARGRVRAARTGIGNNRREARRGIRRTIGWKRPLRRARGGKRTRRIGPAIRDRARVRSTDLWRKRLRRRSGRAICVGRLVEGGPRRIRRCRDRRSRVGRRRVGRSRLTSSRRRLCRLTRGDWSRTSANGRSMLPLFGDDDGPRTI